MSVGLMRKVESRIEGAVGSEPKGDRSDAPRNARSRKKSKLHVRPEELARKLVKEMESCKVHWSSGASVCNAFTVYLCREDYARLERREDQICTRLERHLRKHVRAKGYEVNDDITVSLRADPDLELGRFGLLAERSSVESMPGPTAAMPAVAAPARGAPASGTAAVAGKTQVMSSNEAAEHGLVRQAIVLRAGNQVREFNRGRVIVGRAKDADFRVNDPNVSRRHAAIYWSEGSLMVMDLDSTNGTMVNGYPVASSVLGPDDVVTIGECRITVEAR
jgi:hypothetical protein